MNNEKTKLNCRLITKGTEHIDAIVSDDLSVPDPEPVIGENIIQGAIREEEDGSESDCS